MRLGFYYHVPAQLTNQKIFMPGVQGCFVDSLANCCEQVVCFLHSPRLEEVDQLDYMILSPNVSLVDIGPHTSVMDRTLNSMKFVQYVKSGQTDIDLMLIRGPSPLLPFIANAVSVPISLLLVGDYVQGVDKLKQPFWRKEAIRYWSHFNKWMQTDVAKRSLTFVNSRLLYDELSARVSSLFEIQTTTLRKEDFYFRSDTCQSKPIRLIYAGRMDRAKGILQMVDAVCILLNRGEDIVLDLVGWPEHNDSLLVELQELIRIRQIETRVNYLGGKTFGPELFSYYKRADIFVIASLFEGFPRSIWEAMANSLPVVATDVGSISSYAKSAVKLVVPGDPDQLADAISAVIHQPKLRRQLIVNGLNLVRENTLEQQASIMIRTMEKWLLRHKCA